MVTAGPTDTLAGTSCRPSDGPSAQRAGRVKAAAAHRAVARRASLDAARTMGDRRPKRTQLLARCPASARRSPYRTDSGHSAGAAGTGLHAPKCLSRCAPIMRFSTSDIFSACVSCEIERQRPDEGHQGRLNFRRASECRCPKHAIVEPRRSLGMETRNTPVEPHHAVSTHRRLSVRSNALRNQRGAIAHLCLPLHRLPAHHGQRVLVGHSGI
jgi:hypothetical protein